MIDYFSDIIFHMEWADAEQWRIVMSSDKISSDENIRRLLYHIHTVQYAYSCILRKESPHYRKEESFRDINELKEFAINTHKNFKDYMRGASAMTFEELVRIPWIKNPEAPISTGIAVTQAVMHSHYHRGQIAKLIRAAGGEPPLVDLVIWMWKGKPSPKWQ